MVTGKKVIVFLSIFGSQFLLHQKISGTKIQAQRYRHSRIKCKTCQTQRNYHKIDQNGACKSLRVQVRVALAIFVTMVTMHYAIFCFLTSLHVGGRPEREFQIISKKKIAYWSTAASKV